MSVERSRQRNAPPGLTLNLDSCNICKRLSINNLAHDLRAAQSHSRRNGKVARLPYELRQQINQMLEDGVPYKLIIERLGPPGKHLNEDNISNWRLGGFQDHLKAQAINERARIQLEAAADVIRDSGHVDPAQLQMVCKEIALTQFIQALLEHGENLASESLRKNPAKLITLMNACCNVGKSTLAFEKRRPERGTQNSLMLKTEPIRTHPNLKNFSHRSDSSCGLRSDAGIQVPCR